MACNPRESGVLIYWYADHVKVDEDAVSKLATQLLEAFESNSYSIQDWKKHPLHPKTADKEALNFIFVMDSLNFSFWTDKDQDKYQVEFDGVTYTGYWALVAAIKRAIQEGINISDPNVYSKIDQETLMRVFRGKTAALIPMFEQRLKILHENGQILLEKFSGDFSNVINAANGSAQNLIKLVVENFPSFNDSYEYKGKMMAFYKRSQILVADIWACFEGKGLGNFHDIDSLTMFADYRVPQILCFFKVLKYSSTLLNEMNKREFTPGEPMEVEIRGTSIHAVELIREEMYIKKPDLKVNSILIDFYLWDLRRKMSEELEKIPFHRVRSIFY